MTKYTVGEPVIAMAIVQQLHLNLTNLIKSLQDGLSSIAPHFIDFILERLHALISI